MILQGMVTGRQQKSSTPEAAELFKKNYLLRQPVGLPAGLDHAGQQTLVCHVAQGVATQAKVTIVAVGTAGQPAAVVQPSWRTIAGKLLDFTVNVEFLSLRRGVVKLL